MPKKKEAQRNANPKRNKQNHGLKRIEANGDGFVERYECLFSFHYTTPGAPAGLAKAPVLG